MAKSESSDQAKEPLSHLQDMMNNLQAGWQQKSPQGHPNSERRQQVDKLSEIIRRQQEIMNETFRFNQMQRGPQDDQQTDPFGNDDDFGQQHQQGQCQHYKPITAQEFAYALKQLQQGHCQLEKDFEALIKGIESLGIKLGEGFGEVKESINQAQCALGKGERDRAVSHQCRAL